MRHCRAGYHYLFVLIGLFLTVTFSASVQASEQPNIILIVADYMGYSDIGPYGATDIRTPALNALANQGVKFSNYY